MDAIKDEDLLKFPKRAQTESADDPSGSEDQGNVDMHTAQFQQFDGSPTPAAEGRDRRLDLLMGIALPVSVELGRTDLEIRKVLELKRGSIVEFDKLASEPVDIVVNGKKMAEGEVVVVDKHFAVRITNLIDAAERIKGLSK